MKSIWGGELISNVKVSNGTIQISCEASGFSCAVDGAKGYIHVILGLNQLSNRFANSSGT